MGRGNSQSPPTHEGGGGNAPSRPPVVYDLEAFKQAEYWCWQAYQGYQKAQSDLDVLKSMEKDKLASIMCAFDDGSKISESKLERMARASSEWREYKKAYYDAVRECGEARFKHESTKRYWDTICSGLAFKREELRKLG